MSKLFSRLCGILAVASLATGCLSAAPSAGPAGNFVINNSTSAAVNRQEFSVQGGTVTGKFYMPFLAPGQCHTTDSTGLTITVPCGSGAASIAFTTGSASGFVTIASSPTGIANFEQAQFNAQLKGGSTIYISLNQSSVTLQGNNLAATYLTASSATINFITQSSATINLLSQSSATITYFNKANILPVANGGTGTGSPGLIAGTNITSITGTWPNQTINAATQSGSGGGGPFVITGSTGANTTTVVTVSTNAALAFSTTDFILGPPVGTSTTTAISLNPNVNASTITMRGPGNLGWTQQGGNYQFVGSSSAIPVGHVPIMSSSWSIVDGGVLPTGGGSGGGSSPLGVTTGTATGFSGPAISTPTSTEVFHQSQFLLSLPGATTVFIQVNTSSFTMQGPSPTRLGTVTTGVWNGTALLAAYLPTDLMYNDIDNNVSHAQTTSSSITVTSSSGIASPQFNATGSGNLGWSQQGGSYQFVGSSSNVPSGHVPVMSSSWSIVDGGVLLATQTVTVTISSGTGYGSLSIPVWRAPTNTSVTIVKILAESLPAGTTVLYQLDERAFGSINSVGSSIFSTAFSTANATGVTTTSFNDSSIAANDSLVFTTPASGSAVGAPANMTFTIYYKRDNQ